MSARPVPARGAISVTNLGAVTLAAIAAYVVFVVPPELSIILYASLAGAALVGLLPLAVVFVVVRSPV